MVRFCFSFVLWLILLDFLCLLRAVLASRELSCHLVRCRGRYCMQMLDPRSVCSVSVTSSSCYFPSLCTGSSNVTGNLLCHLTTERVKL
ncbi:hypothetical protein F4803DRAFT_539273, partial [Xylaria telfairii]